MKEYRLWFLFAALLLVCGAALPVQTRGWAGPTPGEVSAAGSIFYVATTGSDSNPGSAARPWRTIGKAARTLDPGDAVYIQNGTYRENVKLDWRNSGTAAQHIVYQAYPGHRPVLDGSTVGTADLGLFELTGADYIEIRGLTVRNSRVAGIHVRGAIGITIKNNRIERSKSSGISVWRSEQVIVEQNVLQDCRIDPAGSNEMLTVATVKDFSVAHNEVYYTDKDCCGSTAGIDVKQGSTRGQVFHNSLHDLPGTGIYLDAWDSATNDIDVSGNYLRNVTLGISLGSERGGVLSDIDIYNNVIYSVKFCGIRLQSVADDGPRRDIHIYHNTIVGSYGHGGAAIQVSTYNAQNIRLTNNLLNFGPDTYSGQIMAYNPSAITSVSNLVYGPKEGVDDKKLVEVTKGTISADPRFVDRGGANFRLRADSPARDRGTTVTLDRDHDGAYRPYGTNHDIGAYEYWIMVELEHQTYLPVVMD